MTRLIVAMAFVTFGLAAAMYHVALQAQTEERALVDLQNRLEALAQERVQYEMLWDKAVNPAYLRTLAGRHLNLQTARPDQVASIDDLPMRGDAQRPAPAPVAGGKTPLQTADASALLAAEGSRR